MGIVVNATGGSGLSERETFVICSITPAVGDNLLVAIVFGHDAYAGERNVNNVVYNDTEYLTKAGELDNGDDYNMEIWYLANPTADGSQHPLRANFGGTVDDMVIFGISMSGADANDPFDNSGYTNGSNSDPSINLSVAAGAIMASAMMITENAVLLTPDQTGVTGTPCVDMGNDMSGAEYTIDSGGGGSNTNSWTYSEDDQDWWMLAASFNAAGAEPFPPVPGRVHRDRRRQLIKM